MRIVLIGAKGIPASASQGGGIERHVEILASMLAERGHRVTTYVRSYANPERKKKWKGVHLLTLPTIRRKHFDAIIHTFLASVHVLFQDVDVIHYHGVGPSLLSWIPRICKPSARIVVTFHSRDRFHDKWGALARLVLALGEWTACTIPHLTIAVSHGIQLFCEKMFGCPAVYIPNGVEIPSKQIGTSFLSMLGLEPNGYFITLGRLVPLKAHDDAIKAFLDLKTNKRLLIIGEPTYDEVAYHEHLQELAAKDPRIVLMGFRTGEQLKQLIAHCYAMIHPSRVEGLSVAILEAMSYGKLVVMSDIPANRELVDHSGIAYHVGRVSALRDVLQWLLDDSTLVKMRGERAREVARRLYSWEHVIERTEAEFDKLLE